MSFYNTDLFTYFVLPLLIFTARIFDVSIGTLRIIFVSKGKKLVAPILGFFEVLIWIIAISKIMQHTNNFACYIGYAAGFATGNYIGMVIEEKLALGVVIIRIITGQYASGLIQKLKDEGHGVTSVEADGESHKVHIIFTILNRKDLKRAVSTIREHNPKAFYTVEDVRDVNEGVLPVEKTLMTRRFIGSILRWRPGK